MAGFLLLGMLVIGAGTGMMNLLASNVAAFFVVTEAPEPEPEVIPPLPSREVPKAPTLFTFADLAHHPERLYGATLTGDLATAPALASTVEAFETLLDIYAKRQGEDDNFTVRVLDNRNGEVLEVFALLDERANYERSDTVSWARVDQLRRQATRRLVNKYVEAGVPKEDIMVRWGRANQVHEARKREAPYIEYEIRLAEYLGLSLLATEIGTVETFNNDRLVSSVGARSRYQIMPYLLRTHGIEHYTLQTGLGHEVKVRQEWHPLLTMETAFTLMRAYVNAVGHEIPGLSAYHTGPFNIFAVYQLFLTENGGVYREEPSVLDAYVWGVTEGFEKVAKETTFRNHSRGYMPSVIGSLRATDEVAVDTSATLLVERLELQPTGRLFLSQLVDHLTPIAGQLDWGEAAADVSLYNRFRQLNPHIDLPAAPDSVGVPADGDVYLTDRVEDATVQFFLPLGATEALVAHGVTAINPEATFRFDRSTFTVGLDERTAADEAYEELVADIGQFGFTEANRARLNDLAEQFDRLWRMNPTHFRTTQRRVIQQHQRLWRSKRWDTLAETAAAALGQVRAPIQPPDPIETE